MILVKAILTCGILTILILGCSQNNNSVTPEVDSSQSETNENNWSAELIVDAMSDEETMVVFSEAIQLDYQAIEKPSLTVYQPTTGMIQSSVALIEPKFPSDYTYTGIGTANAL